MNTARRPSGAHGFSHVAPDRSLTAGSSDPSFLRDRSGLAGPRTGDDEVRSARDEAPGQPLVLTRKGANNAARWKEGERLHHLFEHACLRFGDSAAVVKDDLVLTYNELDRRSNQVARFLLEQGVGSGDRVALLFDKSVETYVALIAVLKVNAAYVPLDASFPSERIRFILADAGIRTVLSMSRFEPRLGGFEAATLFLDAAASAIDTFSGARLHAGEVSPPADQLCYIIYTSGTTGNPKGVAVGHPSICNFVRVAAEMYGFLPGDRVYQGMTIAFDFSVEELWVPLMVGATLIPGTSGTTLFGEDLADFLEERRVTCLCGSPTLLATIERDLPRLRILLVGGEASTQSLVARWSRPGRTILNSYGPTEATVTATLGELRPDRDVTIGTPLPTYSIVILHPETDSLVAAGELGEIGIAGIGVALGYVNRDELTARKFIRDFVPIANNPSGRIYRTGDLGRLNGDGEIEYRGRIDTQIKIRGYRIETAEIEAVLLETPEIAQVAVTTFEPEPGMVELVAYYARKQGTAELSRDAAMETLRRRLPAYMVPAYLEELAAVPMTLSNKADHKRLPVPTTERVLKPGEIVPAKTGTERTIATALCDVLRLKQVSTAHDFFTDLGANSLLMARFCARIRQSPGLSNVSMRDIYTNPTISRLAVHLDAADVSGLVESARVEEPFHLPSRFDYYTCGTLQLAVYAAYAAFGLWFVEAGLRWTYEAVADPVAVYGRAVAFAVASFATFTAIPIAAKWLLIGRWQPESIPLWSLRYLRFWIVKTLVRLSPVAALVGTPVYSAYLRLLGARIGRNVVVQCRFVPVCTDLISIGDNTILRKDSIALGYRAQSNYIHTGPVTLGRDVFVGEASVLDIGTSMGDGSQLGHSSSLQTGQSIPSGKRYHGSPAIETTDDYCPIANEDGSPARRAAYTLVQLLGLLMVAIPVPVFALTLWESHSDSFMATTQAGLESSLLGLLALSAIWFFGSLAAGLFGIYAIPRLCQRFLKPGTTYPMFGLHHWLQTVVMRISNARFYNVVFGDSSFIIGYMRFVGWNLNKVEQTGSNFGTNQRHDNPFLCDIGSGTMVSDGLSMINMQMSSSGFRLGTTRIGDDNYLGNNIHYPQGGRTGANCLLGTKVMIPIAGPLRENVGLLGSPCFEIPRMVARDRDINAASNRDERGRRIAQKNVHNVVTAALFLLSRWMLLFATLVAWERALASYPRYGVLALCAAAAATSLAAVVFFALIERASLGFGDLKPKVVTIHDPYFWWHERHWKLSDSFIMKLGAGTPFKNLILWMVGVKVGRMVYDANCSITERTLTEVGDYANLNEGSVLQAHSLEEGVFKSDHIRMGRGCTLGPGAFVHYGVTMGDHVVLDADSFLMKGEVLESNTGWCGNPAKIVRGSTTRTMTCGTPLRDAA